MSNTVSFTGSRRGLTQPQAITLAATLEDNKIDHVNHGGCIGADEQFHGLCLGMDNNPSITIHPASNVNSKYEAVLLGHDEEVEPRPALERNKDMVAACDTLIACPDSPHELLRSGTWATIRYAKRINRDIMLILPDGTINEFETNFKPMAIYKSDFKENNVSS